MFKPHIKAHEMDDEVEAFEQSILYYADAYHMHGPGSQPATPATFASPQYSDDSGSATPDLSPGSSMASSRASSFSSTDSRRPSFARRLSNMLSAVPEYESAFEDPIMEEAHGQIVQQESAKEKLVRNQLEAWQEEAAGVDRSVRILPGVKRMISSIPKGKYAVATSGAKTYGSFHSLSCLPRYTSDAYRLSFYSLRMHDSCRNYPS